MCELTQRGKAGRMLRYGELWRQVLAPWFRGEPAMPSKRALVYHALMQAVKQMHTLRPVYLQSKRRFREAAKLKVEEIYESWRRSEGRLSYRVEDAYTLLSEVVDGAWAEAFPRGTEEPKHSGTGKVLPAYLPVRQDLAERLREIAAGRGSRPVNLADDAVEGELAAIRLGVKLRGIVDLYEAVRRCSTFGLCLMPMRLLNRLVERLKPEEFEGAAASYREAGSSLGLYLRVMEEGAPLRVLEGIFYSGIFAVTELKLLREGEGFKVRCSAPALSEEATLLLSAFLEGVFKQLGYRVTGSDHSKGIILLELATG